MEARQASPRRKDVAHPRWGGGGQDDVRASAAAGCKQHSRIGNPEGREGWRGGSGRGAVRGAILPAGRPRGRPLPARPGGAKISARPYLLPRPVPATPPRPAPPL
eukprot:scaffold2991_cov403-Prasinococcus_capsulatus_cf.AAC.1